MYPTAKNQVSLIGNLGGDAELKTFENGNQMARFSLATNERFKNKQGEYQDNTLWHTCVVFGKSAQYVIDALKKGDLVAVSGKLNYRQFSNAEGHKVNVTEITVLSFDRLNKRNEVDDGGYMSQAHPGKPTDPIQEHLKNPETSQVDPGGEDDLPF